MENDFLGKIKRFLLESECNTANNLAKSLLIGIVVGVLIGFTGKDWDFDTQYYVDGWMRPFKRYGTGQAVIGGTLITLILFLKYNKLKK
jgi:hypothetical protein